MTEPNQTAQELYEINARLERWLAALSLPCADAGLRLRAATPEQLNGLLSELLQVGGRLRQLLSEPDDRIESELTKYRTNVIRLRDLLPAIRCTLLEERSRLETEQERGRSVAQWALRSRQTF